MLSLRVRVVVLLVSVELGAATGRDDTRAARCCAALCCDPKRSSCQSYRTARGRASGGAAAGNAGCNPSGQGPVQSGAGGGEGRG